MWGWSEGVAGTVSHYISVHTNLGLCAQRSRDGFGERLRICASLHGLTPLGLSSQLFFYLKSFASASAR
jgi:hypothetical protein